MTPRSRGCSVVFDMDGVLIDSEPFWQETEVEIFGEVGVPLTPALCCETMGLRIDEVVHHWYLRHPWDLRVSEAEIERRVVAGVARRIRERGEAKAGVGAALAYLARAGVPVALASSSPYSLIEATCERLGIRGAFQVVHSAEDEAQGKPHPGVYLTAVRKLGVDPWRALAVEDSVNGLVAAKAARMKCLMVPEPPLMNDRRLGLADGVVESLERFEEAAGALFAA